MKNLSTELKTHCVIFKDSEQMPPVLLTTARKDKLLEAWEKKNHLIELDGNQFSWFEIKRIKELKNEEQRSKIKYKFKTDEDYNKEFKERFDLKLFHYLEMNEDEKKEFSRANPYQGFQFDFYEKNPNSTLKEQNEALIKFIKESKSRITPSFLKK